jgi:hypothetical protein
MKILDIIGFVILTIIATILFVILQPGNIFTIPGNEKRIAIGKRETNIKAIIIHSILYLIAMGGMVGIYIILIKPVIDIISKEE